MVRWIPYRGTGKSVKFLVVLDCEYILEMETKVGLGEDCHGELWNIDEKATVVGVLG